MIENAVAVAVIGLFLGPMYPLVMTHTSKVLPKWLVTGAIGWIAGFGQVRLSPFNKSRGGADFARITGRLGDPAIHYGSVGVQVLD